MAGESKNTGDSSGLGGVGVGGIIVFPWKGVADGTGNPQEFTGNDRWASGDFAARLGGGGSPDPEAPITDSNDAPYQGLEKTLKESRWKASPATGMIVNKTQR